VSIEQCRSFIGGQWLDRPSAERLPIISPADESVVAELQEADADTVAQAVDAARVSFRQGAWRMLPVKERQAVLYRIRDLILQNADRIADLECANTGIPIRQIRERHVPRAAANFAFFAEVIGQESGRVLEQQAPISPSCGTSRLAWRR
jgi:acyl-CoA reductase-like NAD-dependent aldehyde dehydrogenase